MFCKFARLFSMAEASIWYESGGHGSENWGLWALKDQQMESHSTWLRVSSQEFLFNIRKSFGFWKSSLCKVFLSYIPLQYSTYNNISWRPHHSTIWGSRPPNLPRIDAYVDVFRFISLSMECCVIKKESGCLFSGTYRQPFARTLNVSKTCHLRICQGCRSSPTKPLKNRRLFYQTQPSQRLGES